MLNGYYDNRQTWHFTTLAHSLYNERTVPKMSWKRFGYTPNCAIVTWSSVVCIVLKCMKRLHAQELNEANTAMHSSRQISGRRTATISIQLTTKSWAEFSNESIPEKVQGLNDLRQPLIRVRAGWNRTLLTTSVTSGADVSMPVFESVESFWLFTVTSVVNCVIN